MCQLLCPCAVLVEQSCCSAPNPVQLLQFLQLRTPLQPHTCPMEWKPFLNSSLCFIVPDVQERASMCRQSSWKITCLPWAPPAWGISSACIFSLSVPQRNVVKYGGRYSAVGSAELLGLSDAEEAEARCLWQRATRGSWVDAQCGIVVGVPWSSALCGGRETPASCCLCTSTVFWEPVVLF